MAGAGMLAALALATLAASCTTASPEPYSGDMEYNCSEKLSSPLGEFEVHHGLVSWTMRTQEGRNVSAYDFDVDLTPTYGRPQILFAGFAAAPDPSANRDFTVFFDDKFTKPDWRGHFRKLVAELRFGDRVVRKPVSYQAAISLRDADLQTLFASDVALTATLFDENGAVLDSFTLAHAQLVVVDQTLLDLQLRVLANLADPETRCRLEPSRDVVIV